MPETPVLQHLSSSFGSLDFLILALGVSVLLLIAFYTGRKESSTADFFLGARRMPAFVACLAFVATEISAVTILSVPRNGYAENLQYLQFFIGSAAARVFIAFVFIPVFYRSDCTTIYQYLRSRFGPATQYAGSVFFFITRLLGSGVRLYAACLGISVIFGLDALDSLRPLSLPGFSQPVHVAWGLLIAIALFTVVSTLYIGFGGIKAVIWTGAYQTVVFYGAGLAVAAYIVFNLQGGPADWLSTARDAGRLSLFDTNWTSFSDPNTILAATLCAFFMNLTVFGTDQDFMQRLLVVKTRRTSQFTIIGTIAAGLPLACIYLFLGTLLFVFYSQHPSLAPPADSEKILSNFVVTVLPIGLKGLLALAVVLASIDSPLVSLSASFVTDIYRPLLKRSAPERHYLLVSRIAVVLFGLILALIAYSLRSVQGILWIAFQVFGITGGSILGVFLLGLLTKRRSNRANVVVMIFVALLMGLTLALIHGVHVPLIWPLINHGNPLPLAWSWLIVIGTVLSFSLAYVLGPILDREPLRRQA